MIHELFFTVSQVQRILIIVVFVFSISMDMVSGKQ